MTKDIRLEDFDISYAGHPILKSTSLHLSAPTADSGGRRYGLVGRNGIGKTTLLKAIGTREIKFAEHISVLHVEQEIHGDDTTVIRAVLAADSEREGLLAQVEELTARLNSLSTTGSAKDNAGTDDAAALTKTYARLAAVDADGAESRAAAILSGLGFDADAQKRATRTFSGGWRMRVALARALFVKPDLLLLDEPTNMLDFPAVVWLEKYLSKWPTTLLVVSHDRAFLDSIATDIIHQHSLTLDHYRGDFSTFVKAREDRKKQRIKEYETQLQYRQHLQAFIDRWRYNANRAAQAQSKIKILEKLPPLDAPTKEEDEGLGAGGSHIYFRFEEPERLAPPIIKMDGVTFGYNVPKPPPPGSKFILENITFDLSPDSKVAVVGPNGAGKTTLLKLINGEIEPVRGQVTRHGRVRIAYFSQHHVDALEMNLTPVQFLAKKFPGRPEEEFRRQLGKFGITGPTGLQILGTLSGGQKSRVVFAWLNMTSPHVLVLDEPTVNLDMDTIEALSRSIRNFAGGVLIVSHDERFLDSVCNEVWVCEGGHMARFEGKVGSGDGIVRQ
ncbi:P-loop containing nucleoside triphosphate hydrolase protein [Gonapodya prolifera JEL478]|uniref:p-loop containing nucleoside triphosphate hydrolase protein n=1 Tax=Gonapodya prolifera (strain JEL478) TaxID=1344416 RepID=A0A139AWI7_GONPJ|nr:P-loop containing nucleoside triphosphate hydrolase protein [Gonapodya prolifera JEL478]|eukprot:KXS21090.1 P-loop containing nucleoside triphosphate hydrolase protein [Gonapodya prolifera JEL478]